MWFPTSSAVLWTRLALALVCVFVLLQGTLVVQQALRFLYLHFFLREMDLPQRYGRGSYVVITGGSSGQGKRLAHEFAARGFNLILVGSVRNHETASAIRAKWPAARTDVIVKDFGQAFAPGFFDDIEATIARRDVSVVVNNVGHRTGWAPYHEQPAHVLSETVACGTLVQCRLTQIALQRFARRRRDRQRLGQPPLRSSLVFITAQCMHGNIGFGAAESNEITVPYLAAYEPANAFGYYHACSIYQEYGVLKSDALGDTLDVLNVTPGAVVTENTSFLRGTLFAVDADAYTRNIVRLMGNVQGTTCAHWGHAISTAVISLCPWLKGRVLHKVGRTIAEDYMARYRSNACSDYVVVTAPAAAKAAASVTSTPPPPASVAKPAQVLPVMTATPPSVTHPPGEMPRKVETPSVNSPVSVTESAVP